MAECSRRVLSYRKAYNKVRFKRCFLSKTYDNLKAGDVILFAATRHGFHNSILMQSLFSHVGMIVEINGQLFLSECTWRDELLPKIPMQDGSNLLPILTRISNYSGQVFLMRLSKPLDEKRKERLAEAALENTPYPSQKELLLGLFMGIRPEGSRHCFQHVAYLLDALKISEDKFLDNGFMEVCQSVSELDETPLIDGYAYEKPLLLVYDFDDSECSDVDEKNECLD